MSEYAKDLHFVPMQKPGDKNCGQQCINFVTDLGLDVITDFIGHNKGTRWQDLFDCLRWFGYDCEPYRKLECGVRASSERKLLFLPRLAILDINRDHWTILFEGYVFDSCIGKFPFVDIERRKGFRCYGYIEINPKYLDERISSIVLDEKLYTLC